MCATLIIQHLNPSVWEKLCKETNNVLLHQTKLLLKKTGSYGRLIITNKSGHIWNLGIQGQFVRGIIAEKVRWEWGMI